jgi:hypothetical protein
MLVNFVQIVEATEIDIGKCGWTDGGPPPKDAGAKTPKASATVRQTMLENNITD